MVALPAEETRNRKRLPLNSDLIYQHGTSNWATEWERLENEGILRAFNDALCTAIADDTARQKLEEKDRTIFGSTFSLGSQTSFRVSTAKAANIFRDDYRAKYFPGKDLREGIRRKEILAADVHLGQDIYVEMVRASVWYVYSYERGYPAFAWLGGKYLNLLKGFAVSGGVPNVVAITRQTDE